MPLWTYKYCKRKSLKLFLNICHLPLIWKPLAGQLADQLSRLDPWRWFQSITHSLWSGTVTLMIVLIIIFVVYCHLSIRLLILNKIIWSGPFFFFFFKQYNIIGGIVRKHLTGGFLCAVLYLSRILWSLLIPEYSGIKRRGTPFLGLRNPGISFVTFSLWW